MKIFEKLWEKFKEWWKAPLIVKYKRSFIHKCILKLIVRPYIAKREEFYKWLGDNSVLRFVTFVLVGTIMIVVIMYGISLTVEWPD